MRDELRRKLEGWYDEWVSPFLQIVVIVAIFSFILWLIWQIPV